MENPSSLLTFVRTLEEEHHTELKQMENINTPWKNIFCTQTHHA
jgi:hypothetical protein